MRLPLGPMAAFTRIFVLSLLRHWDPSEDGIDASLLPHMSPMGWDNIVLSGE